MRLNGRRTSGNIEDRRGSSGGGFDFGSLSGRGLTIGGGGGIVGLLIAALIFFFSEGDKKHQPTAHEEELATFASQILASTEDVWTQKFNEMGLTYRPPKMVFFTGRVNSGCGGATASVGPFYCSADETIYIDLSFFDEMEGQMHAGGDFAYAYVIAHEVGHHVQHLLGTLDDTHARMARMSKSQANQQSVRLELQADYYAGVWAHTEDRLFGSLEEGDIEEGLNAASKIGDDYLQKKAYGYTQPETFNHGTSSQRMRWLQKGLSSGSVSGGDTFSPSYSSL